MSFFESPRFPDCIAKGSVGGPRWLSDVIQVQSGYEQRNLRWQDAMHSYDVSMGVRSIGDMEKLVDFFHGARGRINSFRFKDYSDYAGANEYLGTGDAIDVDYQLTKTYQIFGQPWTREIKKPVAGSVTVALDSIPQPTGWTLDTTNGIVTFATPPGAGVIVSADYQFDVPCRFEQDNIRLTMETPQIAASDVTIVEVRTT